MTVRVTGDGIALEGSCPLEDAETLLQCLLANPGAAVDGRGCTHAHTAVVQVLLAARRPVSGPFAPALLHRWIEPTFGVVQT